MVLPPARRPHGNQPREQFARWSSPEEEAAIEHYARQDGRYRALPRGWEEREQLADFQRRRQAAIGRAQAEGYPEPEPGFTFVRSHERRSAQPSPSHVAVVSRGLLRAVLGLEVPLELREEE
ncbi:MAG TPA: hypothetical protein VFS21_15140 [Roseiflexaceae bacterium]|nr:hypothetical protein [Roseiflexaceae bacterium]